MRHPRKLDIASMSTAVAKIERMSFRLRGKTCRETWANIAGFLGLLPGTVENIVRERHKNDDRYAAKIDAGWIRFLELEIKDAMAELDAARSCADRMDSPEICAAVAALKTRIAEAEKIIGG